MKKKILILMVGFLLIGVNAFADAGDFIVKGKLGVVTTSPNYDLDVSGDINFTGNLYQNGSPFLGSIWNLNGTSAYYNNGNVGIGTTSPENELHIRESSGNTDAAIILDYSGSGGGTAKKYGLVVDTSGNLHIQNKTAGTDIITMRTIGPYSNVGIGTTDPSAKLHIYNYSDPAVLLLDAGSGRTQVRIHASDSPYVAEGMIGTMTGHPFHIRTSNQYRLTVSSSGNVGIGTTSPSYPLHMASGAHVTSGGVWTDASSREYKENIRALTIEEAKTALEELRPTRFNYKVDKGDEYLGFIAEDVPELVATKDRKGLSPMDIIAVLTRVVQQQQQTIEELELKVQRLE